MFRGLSYFSLLLAMFFVVGGHWAVLQSVAWTGMVIEYSRESTFASALEKTFSRRAPCQLCKVIEKGQKNESRLPATIKTDKKCENFMTISCDNCPEPLVSHFFYPFPSDNMAEVRFTRPSIPIPIAA